MSEQFSSEVKLTGKTSAEVCALLKACGTDLKALVKFPVLLVYDVKWDRPVVLEDEGNGDYYCLDSKGKLADMATCDSCSYYTATRELKYTSTYHYSCLSCIENYICPTCNGSGEGIHDGSRCGSCGPSRRREQREYESDDRD